MGPARVMVLAHSFLLVAAYLYSEFLINSLYAPGKNKLKREIIQKLNVLVLCTSIWKEAAWEVWSHLLPATGFQIIPPIFNKYQK